VSVFKGNFMLKKYQLLFTLIFSCLFQTAIAQTKITLANGEWAPYSSKELKYGGLSTHIVTEAFKLVGIDVTYEYVPWERGYILAKQGDIAGQLLRSRNAEREKYFLFSDPIMETESSYFHLKSFPFDWKTIDDLKGLVIGGTIGYNYGDDFNKAEKYGDIDVSRVNNDLQNIKKLILGRIDIFPVNTDVGYYLIHKHLTPEQGALLTHHKKPYIEKGNMFLLLSKKFKNSEDILKLFNKGLKLLSSSGKIELYIKESQEGDYKN
jgi:polar amino acid transport system substrate-binding protein